MITLLIGLVGLAAAANWGLASPAAPPGAQLALLRLEAGEAALLEPQDGQPLPTVRGIDGSPIATLPLGPDLIVPAAGAGRDLQIAGVEGLQVRREEQRGTVAAWAAWAEQSRWALRQRPMAALPAPPEAAPGLVAAMTLRVEAIDDVGVLREALAVELGVYAPLSPTTHRPLPAMPGRCGPERPCELEVRGPATLFLRSAPRVGGSLTRYTLAWSIDGSAAGTARLASSGVPLAVPIAVRDGAHVVAVDSAMDLDVLWEVWEERGWLGHREADGRGAPSGSTPRRAAAALAERHLLRGEPDLAREQLLVLLEDPGPGGESDDAVAGLVRARLLALLPDGPQRLALAALPASLSQAAVDACARAMVARPGTLPPALVLAAALRAEDIDPVELAAWMDGLGGLRPRGLWLLQVAAAPLGDGPAPLAAATRLANNDTRWTRLEPDPKEEDNPPIFDDVGPGIERALLPLGSTVIELPTALAGRHPVLRMWGDGSVRYLVDGQARRSRGGDLSEALSAGRHEIVVEEGRLILLDPELAPLALPVRQWWPARGSASFPLPDPGVGAELRVRADPPGPVRLRFDDGTTRVALPGADGTSRLWIGPHATRVDVEGTAEARVAVDLRVRLQPVEEPPSGEAVDGPGALEQLRALTRRIDAGDQTALGDRALLLAWLSQRSAAITDLQRLLGSGIPQLEAVAWRVRDALGPNTPSASLPGPQTVAAALAASGLDAAPPTGAPAVQAAALESWAGEDAGLWTMAALAWEEAGALPAATRAALHSGPASATLLDHLSARMEWQDLGAPEAGEGALRTEPKRIEPAAADGQPTWRQVREALLGAPWPAEQTVVLRGGDGRADRLRVGAGSLAVDLYCRDESGPDRPCQASVRVDGQIQQVTVPSGAAPVRSSWELGAGEHDVLVEGPAKGQALVVRAMRGGALLPPTVRLPVWRATPRSPLRYVVAAPAVVSLDAISGQGVAVGRCGAAVEEWPLAPGRPALLAFPSDGVCTVEVRGSVDLVASLGRGGAPPPEPPDLGDRPAADQALSDALLWPLVDRFALPPVAAWPRDGAGGTWWFGGGWSRQQAYGTAESWQSAHLESAWMRRRDTWWDEGQGWLSVPYLASGGSYERGWQASAGRLGLRASGAAGTGDGDGAGHLAFRARATTGAAMGAWLSWLAEGTAQARWSSAAPLAPVDPRAWSQYSVDHPLQVALRLGLDAQATTDLRLGVRALALSNSGPSLDRVSAEARAAMLLPRGFSAAAAGELRLRLADDDRATTSWWPRYRLVVDHRVWSTPTRQVRIGGWGDVRPTDGAWTGGLRAGILQSPYRGLSDRSPGLEAWRTLEDAP